ncbi:MAG: hypothetical protein ACREBM_00890 [Sphingomicrobium sp.]
MCAALGACNVALSEQPLFPEAQRSSTLVLEEGLWLMVDDECETDTAKPRDRWPSCADWMVLKGGKVANVSDTEPGEEPLEVFIVDGTPALIQGKVKTNGAKNFYGYLAIEPVAYSPANKLAVINVWPVPCGIQDAKGGPGAKITPYPGFGEECRTTSVDALRAAAARGRAPGEDVVQWRWIRSGPQ